MQGVLKPRPSAVEDAYSQVTPIGNYDGSMQYHQQSQPPQPQTQSWPGVVVNPSPYYPTAAPPYATPSGQPYATPMQPPSASQYNVHNLNGNANTYPDQSPATAQGHNHGGISEEPITPGSAQRGGRESFGEEREAYADDMDELCSLLQSHIDSSFVDGVHELTKSEISLGMDAFVPLVRPHIGPYAEGGAQDLPEEFKQNWTDELVRDEEGAQEGQEDAQTQDQAQDTERDGSQDASQDVGQGQDASQNTSKNPPQPDGDNPQPELVRIISQETPSKRSRPKPEDPLKKCPNATVSSILNISDTSTRSIIQRAASRGIVQRITNLDGFKYMFNNFWTSHVDNDGMRFSYICRDSLQNKDRAAHVPARATTVPPVHSRPMLRKGKEAWDCKGCISVKFSSRASAIVVQYRHAAIHPTFANRARAPKKKWKPPSSRGVGRPRGSGTKRKREAEIVARQPQTLLPTPVYFPTNPVPPPQREPSLFELLQQSAAETAASGSGGQMGSTSSPWWAHS